MSRTSLASAFSTLSLVEIACSAYLPSAMSFSRSTERPTRPLRWWHYPLAVVVPFLFLPVVPLPLLANFLLPHHPKLHFPPIGP